MTNFRYKATDLDGKWLTGEVQGSTRADAEGRLLERGLVVEALDEAESPSLVRRGRDSSEDLAELIGQFSYLAGSGLPLPSGLRAAGREVSSANLRATFFEIADLVESGSRLDEAVAASRRRFPPHLRGLIVAGSRSGRLAELLAQYVRGANLSEELRRMFLWTLAYPLVALVAVIAQVGFICSLTIKVVETLVDKVPDYGLGRSGPVQALVEMAAFLNEHGFEMAIGAVAAPVLAWLTFRIVLGPAGRRRLICAIPVVGPVLRFTSLTEFCHLLAMLIEAETPLPLAFEMAGASIRDPEVADACARMGRAVESGEPLSVAMGRWASMPAGLSQLFRWSEDRRNLPEALHLAGDMFESRARSQSSFANGVLGTFLLLLILWWVGFAVASLYIPLFSLINRLSG